MADNGAARRRAGRRWLWICAGVAAVGAVAAVVGIWHLPDRMYPSGTDGGAEARAALQGGLLTAAAALTAVAGGLIALDETRQANTETRRANVAADSREREANANAHVRELYIAAIGLLSAETVDGRLGGIYALERVAGDSPADQRTVVEVLSAFVREHAHPPAEPPSLGIGRRPATDVQAALTVLGRLPVRDRVPRADLGGADLTGAWLVGADLTNALMIRTTLIDASLDGATLTGAWLAEANLTRASLHVADLTGARLIKANFTDARMGGSTLTRVRLGEATLTRASLYEADLTGAWLEGVQGLSTEQVAVAWGDAWTRLPEGVERPAAWPPYDPSPDPPEEES